MQSLQSDVTHTLLGLIVFGAEQRKRGFQGRLLVLLSDGVMMELRVLVVCVALVVSVQASCHNGRSTTAGEFHFKCS